MFCGQVYTISFQLNLWKHLRSEPLAVSLKASSLRNDFFLEPVWSDFHTETPPLLPSGVIGNGKYPMNGGFGGKKKYITIFLRWILWGIATQTTAPALFNAPTVIASSRHLDRDRDRDFLSAAALSAFSWMQPTTCYYLIREMSPDMQFLCVYIYNLCIYIYINIIFI